MRAAIVLLLAATAEAFTAPTRHAKLIRKSVVRRNAPETEPEDGTSLRKPGREALIYDSRTGRFYEKEIAALCRDEFCAIDETTGNPIVLSVDEKEKIFVECMQAYYYDGREVLNDVDFDQLKEDLMWEGSPVAVLSRDETKFLSAMGAYLKGEPIMSDSEFDALKASLKENGSEIAVSKEPKCSIDTGICSVTWTKDKVRQAVAYSPPGVVFLLLWEILSYELTPLKYVNPIIGLLVGSPLIYFGTILFAENIFYQDPLIASGPCPECNDEQRVFFGGVLGIEGPGDEAKMKCSNADCKCDLTITRKNLRVKTKSKFADAVDKFEKKAAAREAAAEAAA